MRHSTTKNLLSAAATLVLAAGAVAQRLTRVEYHWVTAAQHQTHWDNLRPLGYRLLSLDVAGGRANQRYSAVWDARTGPTFAAIHGATRAQYLGWRLDRLNQGMRPQLVTASGAGSDEVFAAVWVDDGVRTIDLVGVTREGFDLGCTGAREAGYRLANAAAFGSASLPQFNAVFVQNTEDIVWGFTVGDDLAAYRAKFQAHYEGHGRPVFVTVSDTQEYLSIWQDDEIGAWVVPSGLTAAQLATEIDARAVQGYLPVCVQAGGSGSEARYVALFATSDTVRPRLMSRTGTARPEFAAFDAYAESKMRAHGARSAALAIAKDGRLVYARGYTWAEPGFPVTHPTTMFRIASCGKPLTAMCAHDLDERGAITMSTRAGAFLGLGSSVVDFDAITVAHLIQHTSGMTRTVSPFSVAAWLNAGNPMLPVSPVHKAMYAATRGLEFVPGAGESYSNIGYGLLGRVIERASGKTYERFLFDDVAGRLGVTRIRLAGGLRSQLDPNEAFYFPTELILEESQQHTDRRLLATAYSADYRFSDSSGGLATSPVDYVRMLTGAFDLSCDNLLLSPSTVASMLAQPAAPSTHDRGGFTWTRRANNVVSHAKGGSVSGASTMVVYRSDRVSMALFVAKTGGASGADDRLNELADAVTEWGTHDLFPSYGLPTFQRTCPHVIGVTVDQLPNVTDQAFVLVGERFAQVSRVRFGIHTISGRTPVAWQAGWFQVIGDGRIEVHPPQGLLPSTYLVTVDDGVNVSNPAYVRLVSAPSLVLGAPPMVASTFDVIAARGGHSLGSLALLTWSGAAVQSVLPGFVQLGIGNGFTQLGIAPAAVSFDLQTNTAHWRVPANLRPGSALFLQAVIVDPALPLPLPVTNVREVRAL